MHSNSRTTDYHDEKRWLDVATVELKEIAGYTDRAYEKNIADLWATLLSRRSRICSAGPRASSATRRTGFGSLFRDAQNEFFMCEGVCRVAKPGTDIVCRQPGIGLDQAFLVRPFSELVEDKFHGNPSTSDHGLAEHHFRVEFNSIMSSHRGIAPMISAAPIDRCPSSSRGTSPHHHEASALLHREPSSTGNARGRRSAALRESEVERLQAALAERLGQVSIPSPNYLHFIRRQSRDYSPFRVGLAPAAAASFSHTYVPLFVRPYQR